MRLSLILLGVVAFGATSQAQETHEVPAGRLASQVAVAASGQSPVREAPARDAGASSTTGPPSAETELLRINPPATFKVGSQFMDGRMLMVESIEPPETVESWSKLVTAQVFFNGASVGLETVYAELRNGMSRACPGLNDKSIAGSVSQAPALKARLSCPRNPVTGKPEILEAVIVQGKANMMVAQIAFRRPPTAADEALIAEVESSLKVCDRRDPAACALREPAGFVPSPRPN